MLRNAASIYLQRPPEKWKVSLKQFWSPLPRKAKRCKLFSRPPGEERNTAHQSSQRYLPQWHHSRRPADRLRFQLGWQSLCHRPPCLWCLLIPSWWMASFPMQASVTKKPEETNECHRKERNKKPQASNISPCFFLVLVFPLFISFSFFNFQVLSPRVCTCEASRLLLNYTPSLVF